MIRVKNSLCAFFNSYLFPAFIAITVFICHTLSLEAIAIIALSGSIALCSVLCKDLKCVIAPVLMFAFSFSYKAFLDGWFSRVTFKVLAICALTLIAGAVIAHIFIFKKQAKLRQVLGSKIFIGILILCSAFLLNGFFSFGSYQPINIIFAICLVASLGLIYLITFVGLEERKGTMEYLIFVLYVASLLLVAQMLVLLLRDATLNENGSIIKESLIVGWGVWNNIGGMLCMLLPVHFYYACVKKRGYFFYLSAIITYGMIALTLSRSSLLFASIISVICVTVICFKGQNVRINRIITVCLIGVAFLGFIVLFDKISALLGSYLAQGFGDNGRIELYKHGIENFLSHPIFGGGFGSCMEDNFGHGIEPNRYHNTIIELLATCGLVGFGAYVFHRYQTIRLIWSKKSDISVVFLGIVVLALLLSSLLDNHFFNIYPTMYYAIILCVIEKHQNEQK